MLFNSPEFILLFLPATLLGFFLAPAEPLWPRKVWLLAASLFFYAYWRIEYTPILLASIVFNYGVAETIARQKGSHSAELACAVGVAANLALLGFYKYTNFFVQTFDHLWGGATGGRGAPFDIVLPLAISFFTFTQIAYLVDVRRDPSTHHGFLDYALFVAFFPHLIAGPIVRHWEIIPQYSRKPMKPGLADGSTGAALFIIGLSKKVLLADLLSPYVEQVFNSAQSAPSTWFDAWLGTIAFALQIYFDFSGYSDMAIGLARMFSLRFPVNFNSPYQADSISDFWTRWHMTLTRFLREYLYFPLGGNRCGPGRRVFNVMATMLLSGLWHGAAWTYVFWGGLHGLFLVSAQFWRKFTKPLVCSSWVWYRRSCRVATLAAVTLAWVFFRASSFAAAANLLAAMIGLHGVTISTDVTKPGRLAGRLWLKAGARFVPPPFHVPSYDLLFQVICLAALIALVCPNSQQLLADYEPALAPVERPRFLRLRLTWVGGFLLGLALWVAVRGFYSAAPSPFLYFNF